MMEFPVQFSSGISLRLHRRVDPLPDALFDPAGVAGRDRGALAVAGGQVFPGRAGAQDPQDAVNDLAMVDAGAPAFGALAMALGRQQGLAAHPLCVS